MYNIHNTCTGQNIIFSFSFHWLPRAGRDDGRRVGKLFLRELWVDFGHSLFDNGGEHHVAPCDIVLVKDGTCFMPFGERQNGFGEVRNRFAHLVRSTTQNEVRRPVRMLDHQARGVGSGKTSGPDILARSRHRNLHSHLCI